MVSARPALSYGAPHLSLESRKPGTPRRHAKADRDAHLGDQGFPTLKRREYAAFQRTRPEGTEYAIPITNFLYLRPHSGVVGPPAPEPALELPHFPPEPQSSQPTLTDSR